MRLLKLPNPVVGVDGHYQILLAQLGEDRADAGGDRGLASAAFAKHADLVTATQPCTSLGLQDGHPLLVG